MATTNRRKPTRKPRTLKQLAKKVMRSAEDEAKRLIHGVEDLEKKAKSRVKRASKKVERASKKVVRRAKARPRARARGGARAHA